MPPKAPRRTGERILETALAMFNQFGKPTVTTPSIAFEMGISPGNLHYHYHSKEAIVADLCRVPARDRDDACRAGSAPSQRRGLLALSPSCSRRSGNIASFVATSTIPSPAIM